MEDRKWAIVINPKAGKRHYTEKEELLKPAMKLLGVSKLYGLDTTSPEDFCECIRELSKHYYVGVAGGDGSFGDGFNATDKAIGFLPLGEGNAVVYSLGMPRYLITAPQQIMWAANRMKNGKENRLDLVLCNGRKSMFASIGIDSHIIQDRERLISKGIDGHLAYGIATWNAYNNGFARIDSRVSVDGEEFVISNTLTNIVATWPCYGYGLRVVPQATMSGGNLHLLSASDDGISNVAYGILTCFYKGNRVGTHRQGKKVKISVDEEVYLQTDGTVREKGKSFEFEVLPKALRIIC